MADGVFASDLAEQACRSAMQAAGVNPHEIDLIIVATSTPDMVFPSTAAILQRKLGIAGCPVFDVQAVCSGFIYALTVADAMIKTGSANKALVVGSEVFSRLLDFDDRTTCVLFGDGAGAVVVEASDQPGILATDIHADGKHTDILCVPGHVSGGQILGDPLLKMDGQAVFKLAVGVLEDTARASLEKGGQDGCRHRLADSPPGEHPHHAKHGAQAEAAHGQGGRDGGSARQHLGRLHSAGAGPRRARRAGQAWRDADARRRGRWVHLGLGLCWTSDDIFH